MADSPKISFSYCINECLIYSIVLPLLIVVSLSLSAVATSNAKLMPMVKTGVFDGQESTEVNSSLAFTNNI